MTKRVINFAAGPSILPLDVIENAAKNLADYNGSGQSVMEMSHRSKLFKAIISDAEVNLRELMNIPDNYKVLFLQGGGTLQFAMVPLNLLSGTGKADYIVTGTWAKKAAAEAAKFGDIKIVATSQDSNFSYIPKVRAEDFTPDADYVHITYNETIHGIHYSYIPETGNVPLVADMSSCILSEEIDVTKFGLIYAGAQKNVGPSGVTIVIIREDLIGKAFDKIPTYLDYAVHAKEGSLYNTPPCFNIYMAGEVFKKIKAMGGVAEMHKINADKAGILYDCIDSSKLYKCHALNKEDRSLMNVVFVTGSEELDKKFVEEAAKEDLVNLAGHRSIGGIRASIYNAMPIEGVEALVKFMKKFEAENC